MKSRGKRISALLLVIILCLFAPCSVFAGSDSSGTDAQISIFWDETNGNDEFSGTGFEYALKSLDRVIEAAQTYGSKAVIICSGTELTPEKAAVLADCGLLAIGNDINCGFFENVSENLKNNTAESPSAASDDLSAKDPDDDLKGSKESSVEDAALTNEESGSDSKAAGDDSTLEAAEGEDQETSEKTADASFETNDSKTDEEEISDSSNENAHEEKDETSSDDQNKNTREEMPEDNSEEAGLNSSDKTASGDIPENVPETEAEGVSGIPGESASAPTEDQSSDYEAQTDSEPDNSAESSGSDPKEETKVTEEIEEPDILGETDDALTDLSPDSEDGFFFEFETFSAASFEEANILNLSDTEEDILPDETSKSGYGAEFVYLLPSAYSSDTELSGDQDDTLVADAALSEDAGDDVDNSEDSFKVVLTLLPGTDLVGTGTSNTGSSSNKQSSDGISSSKNTSSGTYGGGASGKKSSSSDSSSKNSSSGSSSSGSSSTEAGSSKDSGAASIGGSSSGNSNGSSSGSAVSGVKTSDESRIVFFMMCMMTALFAAAVLGKTRLEYVRNSYRELIRKEMDEFRKACRL